MSDSLQDQLLKAGLADTKKAKQINKAKQKQARHQRNSKADLVDETKQSVQQARKAKAERDRELNDEQKFKAEAKAIAAQVKQLIEMNRISRSGADIDYNFVDNNKVKKILVDEQIQDQLSRGRLAIVKFGDSYEIIAAAVAQKIILRLPERVVVLNEMMSTEPDENDPYAEYQIPDDLMW